MWAVRRISFFPARRPAPKFLFAAVGAHDDCNVYANNSSHPIARAQRLAQGFVAFGPPSW